MIRFSTLGTVRLRATDDADVQSVLSQPMQVALLTYLVVSRPRGFHRRDTLLGLFWPELDESHARGALNQALYRLRGSLGREVIPGRGKEELGVDERLVWSDVWAFERAVAEGSRREAMELYRGDLLAGYYLSRAPSWERWLDGERDRLQRMAGESAWRLADEAAEDDRQADAAYWGRRAFALTPGDEATLRRLISLLDGIGDRASAVRAYEETVELFTSEYGTEPSPETKALIETVRARVRPRQASTEASEESWEAVSRATLPPVPSTPARRRSMGRRVVLRGAVVVLVAAAVVSIAAALSVARSAETGPAVEVGEDVPAAAVEGIPAPEATTAYEQGLYHLSQLDAASAHEARNHFQRALDADPTFTDAWSGLSASLIRLAGLSLVPAEEAFPRARSAAEKALAFDPEHGEAHAVLAWIVASYYWNTPAADSLFLRALELAPNSAKVHRFYAAHLRNLGRLDEALTEIRRAQELDPLFAFSHIEEGLIHYMARDYERAIEKYQLLLRIAPEYRHAHTFVGLAETQRGRYEEAMAALSRADPEETSPVATAVRGYIYARTGRQDLARRMLDRLNGESGPWPVVDMQKALVHLGLGENDRALELIERGLERPTWHMRLLGVEPFYEPIRSEPRFQAILREIGLGRRSSPP